MSKQELNYNKAFAELEKIVSQIPVKTIKDIELLTKKEQDDD